MSEGDALKKQQARGRKSLVRATERLGRPKVCWRVRGEQVELQFVLKAVSLGFGVARPYGDTQAYDVIVESEKRLWRVQVKSTDCRYRGGYALAATHSRQSARQPYEESEIDLLAGYVIPEDLWYLIPVKKVRGHRLAYLFPRGLVTGDQAKFEAYREAWDLLGRPKRTARFDF